MAMRSLALVPLVLLAACTAPQAQGDTGACTGKCDGLSSDPIVATLARLWVEKGDASDSDFRIDALKGVPVSQDGIAISALSINVYTADQDATGGLLKADSGEQTLVTLRDGKYPATVEAALFVAHGEANLVGAELSKHFSTSFKIAGPDALPADKAIALTLPFAIWRVRVASRVDRLILESSPYTRALGEGWTYGEGETELHIGRGTLASTRGEAITSFTVIAPEGTPLTGSGYFIVGTTGRTAKPFTIAGPGDYIAEADGLRKALPGEIAE